jgi:tetratricopeptide (TPR) repeat protein
MNNSLGDNMSETLLDRCYAGLIYDEIEEYEEAIALCSRTIEADATNYIALNNRAVAYWEIGRDEEAMADFLAATEAAPANDPIPKDNLERFQNRRLE